MIKKIVQILIILYWVSPCFAQTKREQSFSEAAICFTWKADSIFVNKIKKQLPVEGENSSVRFNKNHTMVNTDKGHIETGIWVYDDKLQEIVITLNGDNAKITLMILSLDKTKMIAILKYPVVKDKIKMYLGHQ